MISQIDIELLERYIDGTLADDQVESLQTLLRGSAEARSMLRSLATVDFGLQDLAAAGTPSLALQPIVSPARSWTAHLTLGVAFAVATAAVVALMAGVYLFRPSDELKVATISGLGGPVFWTGDGGRVSGDLSVGNTLTGGTIEGTTPDSWVELEFVDGSTVMISGDSVLTFSDFGQKELYLKQGSVTGDVNPQVPDKPMIVHTRSAELEVLGTQFKVEAELASTALNVSQGKVRVKRLSDGKTVDVIANHRVVASAEAELSPETIPESVNRWKSQLDLGPADNVVGQWLPKTDTLDARLKAIPYVYTTPQGQTITLYNVSMPVSGADRPPVILRPDSQIQIRGRLASAEKMFFGVTVRHPDGGYGGNFMASQFVTMSENGDFEIAFDVRDLRLNPTLAHMKHDLPTAASNVVVEAIWCNTPVPAGLEIVEVKMVSPR